MLALLCLLGLAACQGGGNADDDTVHGSGADAQIVDSLILAAQASEASGDWQAAAQYWSSLLQRDPADERYARGLGTALRRSGNYGEAVRVLRHGVEQNPGSEPILAELGKALLAAGQRDEAIATLNQSAMMNPDDWQVQSALAVASGMAGKPDLADQHYRQALALTPDNPVVLNNYALHLAINGQPDAGLAMMEKAATSPDATTQMRQNLALLLAVDGDIDRAEQIVRGELPRDAADRQMVFLQSLSPDDLVNLGAIVDQSDLIIDSVELSPPPAAGNVADLTNVGDGDAGFLEHQEGVTVIEQEVLVAPAAQSLDAVADVPPPVADAPAVEPVVEAASSQTLAQQSAALSASLAEALEAGSPEGTTTTVVDPPAPPPEETLAQEMVAVAVTAETETAVAVAPSGPAWRVQLASLATPDAAEHGRSAAIAEHGGLLADQPVDVVAAELDNGNTTWRVLAGRYADKSEAVALCEAIRGEGGDCFVMKDETGG